LKQRNCMRASKISMDNPLKLVFSQKSWNFLLIHFVPMSGEFR
jgi:hypothetical protein